ncbi:Polyadenylate-binding protein-interacting protein 12 [Morella rubra]|uniref:Polyadenylate-binding protein-interacting protein 12 n=1 Tax=Morella rubra TaxID=262757 RepID=A0A6A1UXL7_9ROSI|nr:Polyadenylate-binding protein-interacting protein 12 [Morella rubra]
MAVAENASQNFENTTTVVSSSESNAQNDLENSKPRNDSMENKNDQKERPVAGTAATTFSVATGNYKVQMSPMANGFDSNGVKSQQMGVVKAGGGYGSNNQRANGAVARNGEDGGESFKRDMRDLEELLSKLNPMAEEFVPPSLANNHGYFDGGAGGFGFTNNFVVQTNFGNANANGLNGRRRRNGYSQGKRRVNGRMTPAQREAMIRRTVYVSDIDQQVTEEQLAALFLNCGQVVDCRVCGDPNSILRFAFIEFTDEDGARAALNLSGTMLGYYPVRVLPSKTAISPVNPTFLPRSEDEREMCSRTIYCTNIDKKVTQADVKFFFESLCGEVQRLRLLGDYHHSTRIAFVEFTVVLPPSS